MTYVWDENKTDDNLSKQILEKNPQTLIVLQ